MENRTEPLTAVFKRCPACGFEWKSREDFLQDPGVALHGYQVHFKVLTEGIFLFNHSCNATMGIHAGEFTDFYQGEIFKERATGTDECPDYCVHEGNLKACPAKCECSYVREVIQIVKSYPKK